mmetsp:Transcript_14127/g.50756  ORF Transcript_14127/g.50756 Transcript_14127/m.50756 type:complete len:232 (-) Transcript_14127:1064-1759(-)
MDPPSAFLALFGRAASTPKLLRVGDASVSSDVRRVCWENHLSFNNCDAVIRSPASLHNNLRIIDFASFDTVCHAGFWYSFCSVTCMRSRFEYASCDASKRWYPPSIKNTVTPALHMSTAGLDASAFDAALRTGFGGSSLSSFFFFPYTFPRDVLCIDPFPTEDPKSASTSGAAYSTVPRSRSPTSSFRANAEPFSTGLLPLTAVANPKSASFNEFRSPGFARSKFSSFTSL